MIYRISGDDIPECVRVIRASFATVAEEFGITRQNAPRFTAFATDEARLVWQLEHEDRLMFAYRLKDHVAGYYSLLRLTDDECELNNLCVLAQHRHRRIGEALLEHAFNEARAMGCRLMKIGIVEENVTLRRWYEAHGFIHTGAQKFDFFPFTCGYMQKIL